MEYVIAISLVVFGWVLGLITDRYYFNKQIEQDKKKSSENHNNQLIEVVVDLNYSLFKGIHNLDALKKTIIEKKNFRKFLDGKEHLLSPEMMNLSTEYESKINSLIDLLIPYLNNNSNQKWMETEAGNASVVQYTETLDIIYLGAIDNYRIKITKQAKKEQE